MAVLQHWGDFVCNTDLRKAQKIMTKNIEEQGNN